MKQVFAAAALCMTFLLTQALVAAPTAADKATARTLGAEGIELYQAHSYAPALDKLGRAKALVATPVLDLYIARCHAELGHLVEAAETYRALVRTPADATAQPAAKKAVVDARDELAALEPRIPTVKILVEPAGSEGLEVQIDGQPVAAVIVGIDRAIDPGRHTIRVARAGGAPAEASIELKAGEKKTVSLKLGDAPAAGAGGTATTATESPAPAGKSLPHRHDGWYLRMALGGGALTDTFTVEGLGNLLPSGKATGASGSAEIALGYSVLPGLAVGGSLVGEQVASPKVTYDGKDYSTISVGTFAMFGPCIEWYPSATGGFHAGAMIGGARLTMKDSSGVVTDTQPVGGGGALGAGYEFWIGDEWSLGGALRLVGASLSDQGIHHTIAAGSLLATLTYQ
jgi:hypothetical protein